LSIETKLLIKKHNPRYVTIIAKVNLMDV